MELKVLDSFIIKSDDNNYILEEYGIIKHRKNERYGIKKTTYHPTLVQAFKYILKQQLKQEDYKSIDDVVKNMESIEKRIANKVDEVVDVFTYKEDK
ncbi:MAG: hypothetical protein ACRC1T_05065 [Clostridium chrysemydis]|uniref:hypothetical protein n=1 Tax=Clostridium chrysemydis TaxID=2665504 RepID=UPI003F3C8890